MSQKRKKAGAYARVSTEEQSKEGLSIKAQVREIENYCEKKGWNLIKKYVGGGFSGGSSKRPQFQAMLRDCKDGVIDTIVFFKLDRFSRNLKDTINIMDELKDKIDFVSVRENIDTTTAMGRAFTANISVFAQLEREQIGERVDSVLRYKFENNVHGGKTPFGYKWNKAKRNIVPHLQDSKKVMEIFERALKGDSYKDICNNIEVYKKTQKKYVPLPVKSYYNILRNKIYCGYIKHKGEEKKGNHEPIISEEMFNEAQGKIKKIAGNRF